jgi:hypothetical protein
MTGGQGALTLGAAERAGRFAADGVTRVARPSTPLMVIRATAEENEAHERSLAAIEKTAGHHLWK